MSILAQSQSVSHASFPPFLMLPAPKIAGLLPSGLPTSAENKTSQSQPASSFTFSDPRLVFLTTEQRDRLFGATHSLLEIATRFVSREMNEDALRAAQALFARKLTGHPTIGALNPAAYRAEDNADLIDWMLTAEKRRASTRQRIEQEFAAKTAAHDARKLVLRD